MNRFFQRLGCCNPSSDILPSEDRQVSVGSNAGSRGFRNSTKHQKPFPKSVPPQYSNFSTSENSTTGVLIHQQNSHGQEAAQPDHELHSDRPAEQGPITMFQNAQHLNFSGNARIMNIGHQQVNSHGNSGLDKLEKFVSFNALHDSSAQDPERCCHPDTRKSVLDKMRSWMDDLKAPERVLWLHGPAGVGKSAIAQTISYSCGRDKIGASFFFFRSDPVRSDGNRLFPTLAWRLASSLPSIKDLIAFALEEDPDIPRKAVEIQFSQLIAHPFLTASGGKSAVGASMPVIIIDGLDECSDVKLQERILKTIGNGVADTQFPLRFIISCRPEAHIQEFFSQFQHPTIQIDLANVDEAYRDIETYLTSEFSRIAVEQDLDPKMWPGQDTIDFLVSKSSGQFIYASTVIRYVGDKYESSTAQLDVILGLKPSNGKSPFAELDALYTEILQRQPDKNFLKEFFPVLVARSMLTEVDDGNFHEDDAMLLDLDEKQLHRKLRGTRSLLKFEPFIDVHHKSFLDFLDDSSRSGEYHVSKHFANRRYMQRITDMLVKVASETMKNLNSHESEHFKPRFAIAIRYFPLKIKLSLDDLEEILRPLEIIQEILLQTPSMSVPWKPRACDKCWTFCIIDDLLLHLTWFRHTIQYREPKYNNIHPLTTMEEREDIPEVNLDSCLSLVLARLKGTKVSLDKDMTGLVRALVRFDPTETAMKIRSMADAQNLVELIFCLAKNECFNSWFGASAHNVTRLAVAIYGRAPLLPRSLFLNSAYLDYDGDTYQGKAVRLSSTGESIRRDCFDAFIWGCLSHNNMLTLLGICLFRSYMVFVSPLPNNGKLDEWRTTNGPVSHVQRICFGVANGIQYMHSLNIVLRFRFHTSDIHLDSNEHAKLRCLSFHPIDLCKDQISYDVLASSTFTVEDNVYSFGLLFYQALFDEMIIPHIRPSKPEIPDNVWQLILWCCVNDPKERPTIDQIVQEMESWISLGQFTMSS